MSALRPVPATRERAVLYLRQSIAREDSVSIELQRIAGEDYCAKQGYDVVAVEIDEGLSGRKWTTRPAVNRVMDLIEARKAEVIVLWKWSRLSRSRKDWALAADRVDVAGGRIESATEPIDTATASGRFARGVMTEYAAFQSEQIGEQWNEVHASRFKKGLPPTGKVPWGWESKKDHIAITDENAEIIRQMYQYYLEGRGWWYIASWMSGQGIKAPRGGLWRQQTVQSCLDSPIHAGKVTYKGTVREGAHDAIIDESIYRRYLEQRGSRALPKRARRTTYLLSGLVICHCGRKRVGNSVKSRWAGGRRMYFSYLCPVIESHPKKSLIAWRVDEAVADWLKGFDLDADHTSTDTTDVELVARELLEVERKLDTLTEHLLSGLVPEASYARTRDQLMGQANEMRERLRSAERAAQLSPVDYLADYSDMIDLWDELMIEDRRAVVHGSVASVTILEDDWIEIRAHWREEPYLVNTAVR